MAADLAEPENARPNGAVVPIARAPSLRGGRAPSGGQATTDELRHDNPRWPVRSPADAAAALRIHDDCPWHCATRVAAHIVSRDDYQYFRDRDPGRAGEDRWTPHSDC